jgi:hypothetical protein
VRIAIFFQECHPDGALVIAPLALVETTSPGSCLEGERFRAVKRVSGAVGKGGSVFFVASDGVQEYMRKARILGISRITSIFLHYFETLELHSSIGREDAR